MIPRIPRPVLSGVRYYASSSSVQQKSARRSLILPVLAISGIALFGYDYYQAQALSRSFRTLRTGIAIAVDYKWNFKASNAEGIEALHQRVADRLHWLCITNQGLYIKLGQALGMQAAVLPAPYRIAFANIFDAAPPVDYAQVESLFIEEFGKKPEEIFDTFDRKAIAAASIAQVHKATVNGQVVIFSA